jgi:cytoskeletal protein CcmA (bactofilin family)
VFRKTTNGPQQPSESPWPTVPTSSSASTSSYPHGDSSTQPKRLTVGPGISLAGEITDCDRLVVQGDARVRLHRVRTIEIAETGRFTDGHAEVEEAEIAGVYEGELTVSGRLLVRSTGRVTGRVYYGELEVERGGRIMGSVGVRERVAETALAGKGSSTVASLRPAGTPGPKRDRGTSVGNGADQGQLPEAS